MHRLRRIIGLCLGFIISIHAPLGSAWTVSKNALDIAPLLEEERRVSKTPQVSAGLRQEEAQVFDKNPSALTSEEQALMDYSRALEHSTQNRSVEAIQILTKSIHRVPLHLPSRLELARLYLKQNRDLDAQFVLEEGLKYSENQPDILKLLAVVLERQGELEAALDQLNKIPADLKNDKNTVALLGHIYQGVGRFALARQQYYRLLQFEPNYPLWVLGLAIALDAEGNRNAALENYQKLQTEAGIDTGILKYVEERVRALKKK